MSNNQMASNNRRQRKHYKPHWEVEKEAQDRLAEEMRKEQERGLENTEENFPALGTSSTVARRWGGRKFNDLAQQWKVDEDEKREMQELKKEAPVTEFGFVLPKFNNVHHFHEKEDAQEKKCIQTDHEWVTVDRNSKRVAQMERRIKRKEEYLRRLDEGGDVEPADGSDGQDETCWNDGPAEHETCWEDKRI